jgi:hypothetical protein
MHILFGGVLRSSSSLQLFSWIVAGVSKKKKQIDACVLECLWGLKRWWLSEDD